MPVASNCARSGVVGCSSSSSSSLVGFDVGAWFASVIDVGLEGVVNSGDSGTGVDVVV